MSDRIRVMACEKRRFDGPEQAKRAHRRASYRIRVYYCAECRGFHVTNPEKHGRHGERNR